MGHHCCVPHCYANSRLAAAGGLTFHSFPVDPKERKEWILSVKRADNKKMTVNKHTKVCSKHFKDEDFIHPQGTKRRMLRKGAVPSIFAWTEGIGVGPCNKKTETPLNDSDDILVKEESKVHPLGDKLSAPEQNQNDKAISGKVKSESPELKICSDSMERKKDRNIKKDNENNASLDLNITNPSCGSPIKSDDSEQGSISDLTATNGSSPVSSTNGTSRRKMSNINFQIGVRLEAKDLGNEMWYPVKVVEVDWDDEEVLIHFEKWSQRYDEWIPMDSSRLRQTQNQSPQNDGKTPSKIFSVGDRVMAKWSDCRRYPATVKNMLPNDRYEVLFFDGFTKIIKGIRMTKLEGVAENVSEVKPEVPDKTLPPPVIKPVVRNTLIEEAIGTKEERRERKRKINVVELFHPKKRIKLEPSSTPQRSSSEPEKGKKLEKGKRRKENSSEGAENEAQTEDNETPKGRKKEQPDESSKSAHKAGSSSKDVEKEGDNTGNSKWKPDNQDGYIVDSIDGPRKTTVIPDKNLPPGWSKHTIQRKHGNSAGKWDVLLVSPQGRRFRSRSELRQYFEETGEPFKAEMFDFCVTGKKRSRASDGDVPKRKRSRGGPKAKVPIGPGGDAVEQHTQQQPQTKPLLHSQTVPPQRRVKTLLPKIRRASTSQSEEDNGDKSVDPPSPPPPYTTTVASVPAVKIEPEMLEGEVLVGGLKIQMDGSSFKCPKEGCGKNFRKENLLQMHIKHYHPEYNKFMGSTPNVADLAYARTIGESIDDLMPKARYSSGASSSISGSAYTEKTNRFESVRKSKTSTPASMGGGKSSALGGGGDGNTVPEKKKVPAKEKVQNISAKKSAKGISADTDVRMSTDDMISDTKEPKEDKTAVVENRETVATPVVDISTPVVHREEKKEPQTTIKTLLPVIRSPTQAQESASTERLKSKFPAVEEGEEYIEVIDVGPRQTHPAHGTGQAPSTQSSGPSSKETTSVTKSLRTIRRRRLSDFHFEPLHKRRKIATKLEITEDVDVVDDNGAPVDVVSTPAGTATSGGTLSNGKSNPTTYRYSRKKTPVVHLEKLNVTPDSNAESSSVEQLRKEELINCTCGFMEEDGLMIQCDLCLCWQHGLCNKIEKETEVPEKYVCPICLNPYRQRKSKKYMHDQDWLKEGKLPSLTFRSKNEANINDREAILKRSHDLTGSLLQIQQVLHSLRVKVNIAGKPDHPKLYLWAKSWEKDGESSSGMSSTQASGAHAQICGDSEFKAELDDTVPNEMKAAMSSSITEASALVHKDLVSGLQENVIGVKCDSEEVGSAGNTVKQPQIEIGVKESRLNESDSTSMLTDEQHNIEETVVTEEVVEESISLEIKEKAGSEIVQETAGKEIMSVGNEVECTSDSTENKETSIVPSLHENSSSSVTDSNKEDINIQNLVITDKQNSKSDPFTKHTIEEANKVESLAETTLENEATLIDDSNVQTTVEVTDSNIPSTPDIMLKETDSHLADESTNASSCSKPMDTDDTSSQLDNHGLLHQALTNGSHSTNPLNGGLGNQIDASSHPMLQLPICQSELMQFASSMADNLRVTESSRTAPVVPVPEPPRAPQPEAPIDPVECRLLLLDHIDHFQQQIDTRLTMLEEQVAALESQDPDAAKDEAADHYPQTKQTIQMLLRDLLTMRKISALN